MIRVVTAYEVHKTAEGYLGMAWKLQLDDYRRIIVFHTAQGGWLLAR